MAKLDEKQVAVARVYARSMLDLAADRTEAKSLLEEIEELRGVLGEHPELIELFGSPLIDAKVRHATLERIFRGRASDRLVDALLVIDRHGRLGLFDAIAETYRTMYQEMHGEVDVEVTTAVALTDALRDALRRAVEKVAGRRPNLLETVDPSLLGGMVVRVGDRKIDTSVVKDLRTVRDRLSDRAAREIHGGRLAAAAELQPEE